MVTEWIQITLAWQKKQLAGCLVLLSYHVPVCGVKRVELSVNGTCYTKKPLEMFSYILLFECKFCFYYRPINHDLLFGN